MKSKPRWYGWGPHSGARCRSPHFSGSKLLAACLIFQLLACGSLAGQPGVELMRDFRKVDIPFEYQNNLIIVNVTFNRLFPLKFIFDTGAENTILSKRQITDVLGVPYEREFKILGADMSTELKAYLIRNIHLRVGDMLLPRHSMLVLDDDYFRFEELSGMEIHGILGADVFRNMVVKINYEKRIITLSRPKMPAPAPKDYIALPLHIHRGKPYLETTLRILPDSTLRVKLLLDSGAMLSLLLNTDTHPGLQLPPETIRGNIGTGLGGFLEGYLGRITSLQVGDFHFNEVLTNFQELSMLVDTSNLYGRNGIIGNEILRRFHVIIDYTTEKLYLQPNRQFGTTFEFDKSGLVVIATDLHLGTYVVHYVLPGSPGSEAGILPGDEIKRINFLSARLLSLRGIHEAFRKQDGKKMKLVIKRDGKRHKVSFRLRPLI